MEQNELQRDLGRLEGKVDASNGLILSLVADFKADRARTDDKIDTLTDRVTTTEKKVYWFSGIGAAVAWFAATYLPFGGIVTSG